MFAAPKKEKNRKKYLDTTRAEALRYLHICAMQSQNIYVDNGDPVDDIPIVEGLIVSGPRPTKRPDFLKPTGPKKREIFSDESDGMSSDDSEESDDVCDYRPRNGDGKLLSDAFTETARFFMVPAADTILKIFHLKTPNQGIVIRMDREWYFFRVCL